MSTDGAAAAAAPSAGRVRAAADALNERKATPSVEQPSAVQKDSSKRGRIDAVDDDVKDISATQDWVTELLQISLDDQKTAVGTVITEALTAFEKGSSERLANTFKAYDTKVQGKFQQHEAEINALKDRADTSEQTQKQFQQQLDALRSSLAAAESLVPESHMPDDIWEGPADKSFLRLNLASDATKKSVENAVREWVEKWSGCPAGQWGIVGSQAGKRFTLKFMGATNLATRRAAKAFQVLRTSLGEWREISAATVGGDHKRIYIDENKSGKQIASQRDTRRAYRAVCKVLGEDPAKSSKVHCNKRDGRVTVNHVPIVKVLPVKGELCKLNFNEAHLLQIQVTRENITNEYEKEAPSAGDEIVWG